MSHKSVIGSILVVSLLLVGTVGGFVFATSTNTGDDPAAQMKETTRLFITTLAANLNIDEATLEAAITATQEDILADQVSAGTITQDQADKAIERGVEIQVGVGHGGPPPDGQEKPSGPPQGESTSTN